MLRKNRTQLFLKMFRSISTMVLQGVKAKEGSSGLVSIMFIFKTLRLIISAVKTDDTIQMEILPRQQRCNGFKDVSFSNLWQKHLAKKFFWGWVNINQEGLIDGVSVSFDLVFPTIIFNVVTSSIEVGEISFIKPERVTSREKRDRSDKISNHTFNSAVSSWRLASEKLGFRITTPYPLGTTKTAHVALAYLPDFGGSDGMVIYPTHSSVEIQNHLEARAFAAQKGFYFFPSKLEEFGEFKEKVFQDFLLDWGFFGKKINKPSWFPCWGGVSVEKTFVKQTPLRASLF